ncbi:MAG: M48 family metalloprotease, partial [Pyrinomonadaceae bacterium]
MLRPLFFSLAIAVFFVLLVSPVEGQQCQAPALNVAAQGHNIFSDQQEMDLGDAVYERLTRDFRVIDDPVVTRYLQAIVDKLVRQMPSTTLRFRVALLDLSDANALSMPGGRLFISRKMVAFVNSEDELAVILAHELGHAFARHSAIDTTFLFKELLGVTEVTDRRDIFAKYNRMIEMQPLKPDVVKKTKSRESGVQGEADLLGLYALALAGYDPQAAAKLWDRYSLATYEKEGAFARIFGGGSSPDKKRLAEMLKFEAMLPSSCLGARVGATAEFKQYQQAVVNYLLTARSENLPGLVMSKKLAPPLKNRIRWARFSLDGRYLLAQDDAGITVIDRKSLSILSYIPAPDAVAPQFTPDSQEIVFRTANLRVERWSIVDPELKSAHELFIRSGCLQSELSPDGKVLACFDIDYDLSLAEVATGNVFFLKRELKSDYDMNANFQLLLAARAHDDEAEPFETALVNMGFSPDGRYFLAGGREYLPGYSGFIVGSLMSNKKALGYDLQNRSVIPLSDDLQGVASGSFAFVGTDKIAGFGARKSFYLTFPEGKAIDPVTLPGSQVRPVTRGNAVIIPSSNREYRCMFDLTNKKANSLPGQTCLDAFDATLVAQTPSGDLGFYDLRGGPTQVVKLAPRGFTKVNAGDVSPDLNWLAVSNSASGGVWNLTTGEQVLYLRGFYSGYFNDDGSFYADLAPDGFTPREFKHFNLATREVFNRATGEKRNIVHEGTVAIETTWMDKETKSKSTGKTRTLVSDATTAAPLWTLDAGYTSTALSRRLGTMILSWAGQSDQALREMKEAPAIKARFDALKDVDQHQSVLVKVVETRTGKLIGRALLEPGRGTFKIRQIISAGNWLVAGDSTNRVLVYALDTGDQKAAIFGVESVISPAGNLLVVQ